MLIFLGKKHNAETLAQKARLVKKLALDHTVFGNFLREYRNFEIVACIQWFHQITE